jgi:hypothetical protein
LTNGRYFAADKAIDGSSEFAFWLPLERRSAFIGAFRRQKTRALAMAPNVGHNETENSIGLMVSSFHVRAAALPAPAAT